MAQIPSRLVDENRRSSCCCCVPVPVPRSKTCWVEGDDQHKSIHHVLCTAYHGILGDGSHAQLAVGKEEANMVPATVSARHWSGLVRPT